MGKALCNTTAFLGKDAKKCNGDLCKGKLRPLNDFYTKGLKKDGSTRYESICKSCKSLRGKKQRDKNKKRKARAIETKKLDIKFCNFIEEEYDDFVKDDFEKELKQISYDLILD